MDRTLWMGDLELDWSEEAIAEFFVNYHVRVSRPFDSRAGRPALYCFVLFDTEEEAMRAYELNGRDIPTTNKRFRLNPRTKKRRRSPTPEHRLTLYPGKKSGQVPTGVPASRILEDFLSRQDIVGVVVNGEISADAEVETTWESLCPILEKSYEGNELLKRSVVYLAALAASIEAPSPFLVVQSDPIVIRVDVEPDRLLSSMRQLVELDVDFEEVSVSSQEVRDQSTPGAKLVNSFNRRCPMTRSRVRISSDQVHEFKALRLLPLVSSSRLLESYDFSFEVLDDALVLRCRSLAPSKCTLEALCCEPASHVDAVYRGPARGSIGAINLAISDPTTVTYAEATLDLRLARLADVLMDEKAVVVSGPTGSGAKYFAERLGTLMRVRGFSRDVTHGSIDGPHKSVWCYCSGVNLDDLNVVGSIIVRQCRCIAGARSPEALDDFFHETPPPPDALIFNAVLPYELHVLKPYLQSLYSVPPPSPKYVTARTLLSYLDHCHVLVKDALPSTSFLRAVIEGNFT